MLNVDLMFFVIYALVVPASAQSTCPRISVSRSALSSKGSSPLPLYSRAPPPSSSASPAASTLPPVVPESPALPGTSSRPVSEHFVDPATSTNLKPSAPEIPRGLFPSSSPPTFSFSSLSSSSVIQRRSSTFVLSHSLVANVTTIPNVPSSIPVSPVSLVSLPSTSTSSPPLLPSTTSMPAPFSSPSVSPLASSSASSASSSKSVCWGSETGDSMTLSPDHRGNLWLLDSYRQGSQVSPGRVWVLNFTSLTWQAIGKSSDEAQTGREATESQSTMGLPSLSAMPPSLGANDSSNRETQTATTRDPLVFCPWSHGLVALYISNTSTTITWLLSYGSDTWRRLHKDQGVVFTSEAASLVASWCGRDRDALWLLTTVRSPPTAVTAHDATDRQTLWKLDHRGKWSALHLVPGREEQFSVRHNIRSWSDNRGALFLLQEVESSSSSLRLVKFNTVTGTRTILALQGGHDSSVWVPSSSGELYSIFSDGRGSWIVTFSYYTGVVLRSERTRVPLHTDNLLVKMNQTIYNNIPMCDKAINSTNARSVAKEINLYHISQSPECPQSASQHTTTLQHYTPAEATTSHRGTNTRQFTNIQATVGEGSRSGEGGDVSTSSLPDGESAHTFQTGLESNLIFVMDGKNESDTVGEPPHQRDKNHANNSIIFFSLSLSIFALVGIIIFVRRCVRCPLAHELVETREDHGKPPSPLPVLYSIVSDDPAYETSTNNSPCPSHNAVYDATVTTTADTPSVTTPNDGTPNYMTPSSTTPMGLSPTTPVRHTLTPASYPKHPVSFAITNTTTDAITIATNNAFTRYLANSVSDPTSLDTTTSLTTTTSTTQF